MQSFFDQAKRASRAMPLLPADTIDALLRDVAEAAVRETDLLLAENRRDLDRMDPADPKYDRLQLSVARIQAIAADIRAVATLDYPVGKVLEQRSLPNGLHLSKVSVPLGVVGIIYEARPNVTFDVFALCLKSGNVGLLKGGSDAQYSNAAIATVIRRVIERHGLDPNILQLLPPDRAATDALLGAVGLVDVIIPRGSQALIDFVRTHAKVPVIETGAGIVHTYFDEYGDLAKAVPIVYNAKTRRVSVCNALDCLIIHQSRVGEVSALVAPLADAGVQLFADERAYASLVGHYPASLLQPAGPEHFGTEFLSYKMALKTVDSLPEALDHIAAHSSGHSEAIITEDVTRADDFLRAVDAAVVYVNTSTAFTDGAQFGLGAEIGISTQKLHARGPMALAELTSYKWLVRSDGQVRG